MQINALQLKILYFPLGILYKYRENNFRIRCLFG